MNIFRKKKPVEQPKLFTVELEFMGTNNRLTKVVHKHVRDFSMWLATVGDHCTIIKHHIWLADGSSVFYRETDSSVLVKVETTVE